MTHKWALGPLAAGVLLLAGDLRAADAVTFSETIAPILYQNCVTCHRPGEAAPFALISYDDARRRGTLIAAVTKSRYMPPWHAAHGYGEFRNERRLTDEQMRDKLPGIYQRVKTFHAGKVFADYVDEDAIERSTKPSHVTGPTFERIERHSAE